MKKSVECIGRPNNKQVNVLRPKVIFEIIWRIGQIDTKKISKPDGCKAPEVLGDKWADWGVARLAYSKLG